MPLDSTDWPTTEIDETTALLIRARGFIERGWCRNALARNDVGEGIWPTNTSAVAWCAGGALIAAGMPTEYLPVFHYHPALQRLMDVIGGETIPTFNNRQESVEPILAAFDRAIADRTSQ